MQKSIIISSLFAVNLFATPVYAEELAAGSHAASDITIALKDHSAEIDPNAPQSNLTLENIPESYSFKSTVTNARYCLTSTLTNEEVSVFNDQIARDWSVQATLEKEGLTLDNTEELLPVSHLTINEHPVIGTGNKGIIATSLPEKDAKNNTGLLKTPVTKVTICFNDTQHVLKSGDTISGTISYQLFNTATAS